jgi:hypothetical protein
MIKHPNNGLQFFENLFVSFFSLFLMPFRSEKKVDHYYDNRMMYSTKGIRR